VIDAMSFNTSLGAEIDYKEDLQGAQFVIKNPNATSTCGCGSSFSAELDLRCSVAKAAFGRLLLSLNSARPEMGRPGQHSKEPSMARRRRLFHADARRHES